MKTGTRRPDGEFFPSRRDPWLVAFVWGPLIGLLPLVVISILSGEEGIYMLLLVGVTYGFVAWIWFDTGYIIGRDELYIRGGPFRWRVKLSEIERIQETRSWLASAALSSDRLEIRYRRYNTVEISPKEKELFLERIAQLCPQATIIRSDKK